MELWANIGGEKFKFQGSFKSVMEQLLEKAKDKEAKLLSFHTGQKERRRFKRDYRAANKDLVQLAKNYLAWSYTIEIRKLNQQIKQLNKKRKLEPKKAVSYEKQIEELKSQIENIKQKLNELC